MKPPSNVTRLIIMIPEKGIKTAVFRPRSPYSTIFLFYFPNILCTIGMKLETISITAKLGGFGYAAKI